MKTEWILSAAFAALLACGPLRVATPIEGFVADLASRAAPAGNSSSTAAQPTPALTRAFIEDQDTDLLRLSLISREATELLVFGAQKGTKTAWFGTVLCRSCLTVASLSGPVVLVMI
jgi:hypothetical protein